MVGSFTEYIKAFQATHGLVPDGIPGPKTTAEYRHQFPRSRWIPECRGFVAWDAGASKFRADVSVEYVGEVARMVAQKYNAEHPAAEISHLDLIRLVEFESRFDPVAVSPTGHVGLTQLGPLAVTEVFNRSADPTFGGIVGYLTLPKGKKWLVDPYDPLQNLLVGWEYYLLALNEVLKRYPQSEYPTSYQNGLRGYLAYVFGVNNYPLAISTSPPKAGRVWQSNRSPLDIAAHWRYV